MAASNQSNTAMLWFHLLQLINKGLCGGCWQHHAGEHQKYKEGFSSNLERFMTTIQGQAYKVRIDGSLGETNGLEDGKGQDEDVWKPPGVCKQAGEEHMQSIPGDMLFRWLRLHLHAGQSHE